MTPSVTPSSKLCGQAPQHQNQISCGRLIISSQSCRQQPHFLLQIGTSTSVSISNTNKNLHPNLVLFHPFNYYLHHHHSHVRCSHRRPHVRCPKRRRHHLHVSPAVTPPSSVQKRSRPVDHSPSPSNQQERPRFSDSQMSSPASSIESSLNLSNRYSILEVEESQLDQDDVESTPSLQSLPNNRFMTVDAAYKTVTSSTDSNNVLTIPTGPKNNVFAMLRINLDSKLEIPDDCGVWGRAGTTVNTLTCYKTRS